MVKIRNQIAKWTKNNNNNEIKIASSKAQLTIISPSIPMIQWLQTAVCCDMSKCNTSNACFENTMGISVTSNKISLLYKLQCVRR